MRLSPGVRKEKRSHQAARLQTIARAAASAPRPLSGPITYHQPANRSENDRVGISVADSHREQPVINVNTVAVYPEALGVLSDSRRSVFGDHHVANEVGSYRATGTPRRTG
jgi:hypothetical protein